MHLSHFSRFSRRLGLMGLMGLGVLGVLLCESSVVATPASFSRLPSPHGLTWGARLSSIEHRLMALGAHQRLRLVRITPPKGSQVENAHISARFSKGRFRKLKLVFFNRRLVRVKLYGARAVTWLVKKVGKPHWIIGTSRYWANARKLSGIRCEGRRCELFDLRPMIGHGLSRQEAEAEFKRSAAPPVKTSSP